mmetsp:Transcript_24030/g.66830  ORF Transcript_24030/g.66830 Transcript_24030/m.66830 type:complete len:537 (-) Transcript_24030:91-1701(-)
MEQVRLKRRRCGRLAALVAAFVACLYIVAALALAACAAFANRAGSTSDGGVSWNKLVGNDNNAKEPGVFWILVRSFSLTATLAPLVALSPLAACSGAFRRAIFYPLVARALGAGGPALTKWGQWSATRPDMFPQDLCDAMRKLHSKVPAHSWRHTRRVCEAVFGKPIEEVFSEIRHRPVASGSIAQVYEAFLHDTGERVAVKVRHPNVMEHLWIDIQLMRGLAWACDRFVPALGFLHLRSTVAQFSHTLAAQARLDVEARYLQQMQRNFASRRWRDVRIPQALSWAPALIVESFETGRTVGAVQHDLDHKTARFLVNRGQDVYLKMLLKDRFMHADLHPGNILVDTSGKDTNIVLVDLGMVARLSEKEQLNFVGLLRSLGYGDGAAAATHILHFCDAGEQTCVDGCAEAFRRDMVTLFTGVCRGFGTGTNFGEVLRGVLELVRRHGVVISANYATLVVNALCLDGLAADLAPEYNLLDGSELLLRLSGLLKIPMGPALMQVMYPAVSALKVSADRRFRRRALDQGYDVDDLAKPFS